MGKLRFALVLLQKKVLSDNSDCKGTYGEILLKNFQSNESVITIGKVSDEEIYLFCQTKWGDEWIDLSSEVIPLSGEPYNVKFNTSATSTKVKYNTPEWQTVSTSFNGWIKRVDFDNTRNTLKSNKNENDPPTFHYECDINISCILKGLKLTLNITSI